MTENRRGWTRRRDHANRVQAPVFTRDRNLRAPRLVRAGMNVLRSTSSSTTRKVVAFALLVSFVAASFEAVAGLARDGSVHHETVTEALTHSTEGASEHGHEAASEAPDQEHGTDHQHGTGADHCTHPHGAALLTPTLVALVDDEIRMPPVAPQVIPSNHRAPPLFHPPRA